MTQPERGIFPDKLDLQIISFDELCLSYKALKEARKAHSDAVERYKKARAEWDNIKPGAHHADL